VVGRAHLSIGEVLSLLHEEFPDVTISKIRFLESQGLVDPERTPSGYRKFYEPDIERLRWVLRQQRDAFLPLKVIKDRLEGQGDLDPDAADAGEALAEGGYVVEEVYVVEEGYVRVALTSEALSGNGGASAGKPAQLFDLGPPSGGYAAPASNLSPSSRAEPSGRAEPASSSTAGEPPAENRPRASRAHAAEITTLPVQASPVAPAAEESPLEPAVTPERAVAPERVVAREPAAAAKSSRPGRPREVRAPADDELALAELVEEAGVDVETVRDLEQYGLIAPRIIGGAPYYTREAAVIARLAWAFARHGVEARHLRAYKGAAEREAGLVQQVIMPLLRQRNPQAREAAAHAVDELSELGGELRTALLRAALADLR
jgi:DNA-binding transcriptional MerR regulator